jgi:ATP-dependent exoDNAse (exonuclease V) alpha subunit
MFLTNKLFNEKFCNGLIGIVTKLIDKNNIKVVFSIGNSKKMTAYFKLNTIPTTYSISTSKAFALTVHKTQGLTLPYAAVSLDEQMFANGQTNVAMSRAKSWKNLEIRSFNPNTIKVDNEMLTELDRLQQKFNKFHLLYL